MTFTKRLIYLSLAGGIIVLISGFAGMALAIITFVLVNLCLIGLIIADFVSTPKTSLIEARRELNIKLSLATENNVEIVVRNNSDQPLFVEVTDNIPMFFSHTLPMEKQWVYPHAETVFKYRITPEKRGEYHFDAIHIRYTGIYGIVRKQLKIPTDTRYKVFPNMKALTEYRLSALNRNMFLQGMKRIRKTVTGGEFDSLREYNEGDPYNIINWAATARRNDIIVNTYKPERNQYIFIMVDSSRVMNAEYNNIKKLDYAINAAFLLSDYCINGGDNVGLMVFDNKVRRYLSPAKGNFDAIAENLYNVEYTETAANYDLAIKTFAMKQRRRCLVFVFTDLFNSDEALRLSDAINTHMSQHLVYTITINDPRLPEIAAIKPQNANEIYTKSAAVKLQREREKIQIALKQKGIMSSDIEPDKLSLEAVSTYVDIKRSGIL